MVDMTPGDEPGKACEEHEVLSKIDALAASQYRNGNFVEAVDLLRKALSIRDQTGHSLGKETEILNNMNNLAVALSRIRKFDEAEEKLRHVLSARESSLGCNHIDTLMTANYLGVTFKQKMKLLEAEKLVFRALTGFDLLTSEGCPFSVIFAEVAYNYAVICVQLGKRRKAGRYFEVAHCGLKCVLGGESMHTLDALDWEIKCKSSAYQYSDGRSQADSIQMNMEPSHKEEICAKTSRIDEVNLIAPETEISIDDEKTYLSRSQWQEAHSCDICGRTFKVFYCFTNRHLRNQYYAIISTFTPLNILVCCAGLSWLVSSCFVLSCLVVSCLVVSCAVLCLHNYESQWESTSHEYLILSPPDHDAAASLQNMLQGCL